MVRKMAKHKTDFTNVKCCICGTDKVNIYNGIPDWRRYYGDDHNKEWDRISFACSKCNGKIRRRLPYSTNHIMKSVRNCRTGNQYPNHESTKADKSQALACELYGWIDLNKENDNHNSPLDCYDPKTGLFHQIQMRCYNRRYWRFGSFEGEWEKKFEDTVCFCISEDGKIIERIYKFLWKEIMIVKTIYVYENNSIGWYEKYRVKDEEILIRANNIWEKLNRL